MRIIIPGADFSSSGLGRSVPLIRGMPADGLSALYFFEDGTVGQPTTEFRDLSGNGRHATLHGAYVAPTKRAWGLEVANVNGLLLNSGMRMGQQRTILLAVEALVPSPESGVFQTFIGVSGNNPPTDPAASVSNAPSPTMNFSRGGTPGSYGMYDSPPAATLGTGRISLVGGPINNQATVFALRVNAAENTLAYRATSGTERIITRPEIGAHYATDCGSIMFGAWGQLLQRPAVTPNARIFGAAIYDRVLPDDLLLTAMTALRRPAETAGISFVS